MKSLVNEDHLMRRTPKEFVQFFIDKGIMCNEARQKAITRYHQNRRQILQLGPLELAAGEVGTISALAKVINFSKLSTLKERGDFDEHTAFVVGEPILQFAEGKTRVAVVFSTENCLLNAQRAMRIQGEVQVVRLMMDTTWRLVTQGHGTILFGVMAPDQHFHIVGYAVVSKEDTEGHAHCLRQIKKGVEDVVNEYSQMARDI
jgi:hypothetical protein